MINTPLQKQPCPSHYSQSGNRAKTFRDSMVLNDNMIQTEPLLSEEERSLPKHSKIDDIVLMHLLKRSAGDDRGWKHTFWAWMESRWKEFAALAQGPNSWLYWYDSLTRQHTRVPDSSRKHYENHHRRPSVSYLHVFKSTAPQSPGRARSYQILQALFKKEES